MAILRLRALTSATIIALSTFAALAPNRAAIAAPMLREYEVKAVFLFNFTQFVEWPEASFSDDGAPFIIGVLGRDPFGKALDDAIHGETVNGRRLIIQRYRTPADLKPCQILFIDRSAGIQIDQVLDTLQHKGTLTVTDAEDTAPRRDVVIRFLTEQKKIRLRINLDSARSEGLTISSKLLRPAEIIGTVGTG